MTPRETPRPAKGVYGIAEQESKARLFGGIQQRAALSHRSRGRSYGGNAGRTGEDKGEEGTGGGSAHGGSEVFPVEQCEGARTFSFATMPESAASATCHCVMPMG